MTWPSDGFMQKGKEGETDCEGGSSLLMAAFARSTNKRCFSADFFCAFWNAASDSLKSDDTFSISCLWLLCCSLCSLSLGSTSEEARGHKRTHVAWLELPVGEPL